MQDEGVERAQVEKEASSFQIVSRQKAGSSNN
jgi:hypothetical protein